MCNIFTQRHTIIINNTQWWVSTLAESRVCEYFLTLETQKYIWLFIRNPEGPFGEVEHSSASPWCSQNMMSKYERKGRKKKSWCIYSELHWHLSQRGGLVVSEHFFEKAGERMLKLAVTDQFTSPSWGILIALRTWIELPGKFSFSPDPH